MERAGAKSRHQCSEWWTEEEVWKCLLSQRVLGPTPKPRGKRAIPRGQPALSTALTALSSLGQVLFALNQTLLQHESVRAGSLQVPYTTEDLIKHYNCGDLNAVIFNHDTSQVRCLHFSA